METTRTFLDYAAVAMTVLVVLGMLALLVRTFTLVLGFLSLSFASWLEWFKRPKAPREQTTTVDNGGR